MEEVKDMRIFLELKNIIDYVKNFKQIVHILEKNHKEKVDFVDNLFYNLFFISINGIKIGIEHVLLTILFGENRLSMIRNKMIVLLF